MIIYTNDGNPLGLKLLICAKLAKKNVELKTISLNDTQIVEPRHLPILELDSGIQLFSSDAAAKYLLSNEEPVGQRDKWLEFSTARLAPALAHHMAISSKSDPNSKMVLNSFVKKLDDALKDTPFLTGDKITSADVACWSLLAPDGTLKGAHDIDNVLKWYRTIAAMDEVKSALETLPIKNLHFTSLQHANHYGGLYHIPLIPHIGEAELNLLVESPANIMDTILPEEIELAKLSFVYTAEPERKEPRTVLPKAGERNILITSALPYVNNVPHLGNVIGCVLSADIFARYSRLCGYNTLYVCGTDEYGTATETKAIAENLTPKEICDKYFEIHNSIYRWFGIGFDYFGRTSTPEQTEIVHEIFLNLYAGGYIDTQFVEQLLCVKCNRFLADRFVEGTCPHPGCGYEDARGDQCDACGKLINANELIRPRCKICSSAPVVRQSKQFFIDLPKIEPRLKEWIDSVEMGWTTNARMITRSWIKEGLKPRCITRDLKWGVSVPIEGFEDKVFYVWFDAPIGYISITNKYTKNWREWWQPLSPDIKVELFQFMAKDNVPFHSVLFPSFLIAANEGYTLVSHVMATEYLNYEDGKFSKSRGIGVFGNDAQDTGIAPDIWRFYLASIRPEGQDSSFSWTGLATRNNSELLNNFGNYVNRALAFCEKNFNSIIPNMQLNEEDFNLIALINREIKGYVLSMEKAKFRDGIRHTLTISRHGNQYIQSEQPWVLIKGNDADKARSGTIIGLSCNIACLLATLIFPFMPSTSRNLFGQLNVSLFSVNPDKPQLKMHLKPGHKIGKPVPLFVKIEQARVDELKKKYAGTQTERNSVSPDKSLGPKNAADLEKMVADQAEKVRKLKSSGGEKSVWEPEVKILLELKKQLAELQKGSQTSVGTGNTSTSSADFNQIKDLEDQITQQGLKVRQLKSSSEKTIWQPEVDILLNLKKQLTALVGSASAPAITSSGKKNKKK